MTADAGFEPADPESRDAAPASHPRPLRPALVSLVGAGPGDPELLTLGGAARLADAGCIIYDRLANPALLRHAPAHAELIYAGKLPDRHSLTQDQLNALLVEKARAGMRVVRLKGGDPFVFGRGGEEAEALVAAGISFEVLPGVTSAIAAPAYAGIPLTHRALASSFAVITGHEDPAKDESAIDWQHLARGVDTLVFLMGTARLDGITRRLIAAGRDAQTPAAVIEWGTLPRQRTVPGTLANIAATAREAGVEAPAVLVIGEVAALRRELRWFDTKPLFGKRVLVTRTREQSSALARALAASGAEPIELPTIEIVPAHDPDQVTQAIEGLRTSAYRWVILTSANGVEILMRHLRDAGLDARAFGRASIAAIGPGTAAALESHGLRADIVPEPYVAESLIDALAPRVLRGQRILLPRAADARQVLPKALTGAGALVDELVLYRSAVPQHPDAEGLRRLRAGEVDIVTFASSSSVRNLLAMLDGGEAHRTARDVLRHPRIAAIGPITAEAVRQAGLEVAVMAKTYTIEGLVAALVESASGEAASR